jgi:hypothetical protein
MDEAIALVVNGVDPENDVASLLVTFYSGADVLGESEEGIEIEPTVAYEADGSYTAVFGTPLNPDFNGITSIELKVVDRVGLESAPIQADTVAPEAAIASGGLCLPSDLLGTCANADEACVTSDDGLTRCDEYQLECPGDWPTVDLLDYEQNGSWIYAGDNTGAESYGTGGSCGGGGPNDILVFTAAEAGTYHATIDAMGDTLLYVRNACSVADTAFELACNDDYNELLSGVEFDLGANEVAYLFVDGYTGGFEGPYTVTVNAGPLPEIAE